MDAGKRRERVDLQSTVTSRGAMGSEVVTWQTQSSVWASVQAITGREVHAAGQLKSSVTLRVQIALPTPAMPDATWRVLWKGNVLAIAAILPAQTNDFLTLLCSQGLKDDD